MIRPGIKRAFRLAFWRARAAEVGDEIRLHLELREAQLIRNGMDPDTARAEARRRLGVGAERDLLQVANERDRTMRLREWIYDLAQDVRLSVRALIREPLFSGFVILTLALGIGGNAAMFGVADRLLIRGPGHIVDPQRVQRVYYTQKSPSGEPFTGSSFGYVAYALLKHDTRSFDGVAAYSISVNSLALGRGIDAQLVSPGHVTADLFPTLGVQPALGRFFTAEEDRTSGADRVAVLGYGLWRDRFAGAKDIVGTTIVLGNEPYTIIGVAPSGFTGPQLGKVDVWLPMSLRGASAAKNFTTAWNSQWLRVIVRLKHGITPEQAGADATAAFRAGYTGTDDAYKAAVLFPAPISANGRGKEALDDTIARWLLGVAVVVLLIACANVVNLLLARAARRRREIAVRLALGAGRGRLIRLLLTESTLLALAGGVAGLVVAWVLGQLLRSLLLPAVDWSSSSVDVRVLCVSAVIALGVGVLVGLVPALRSSRLELSSSLKSGARDGGGQNMRLQASLTVAQAALSIVLLVGAGLFVRSLWQIHLLDLGIQPDRVLVVTPRWPSLASLDPAARASERTRRAVFYQQELERIRRLPDVERASLTVGLPFNSGFTQYVRAPGLDSIPLLKGGGPYVNAVTNDYFETIGTRIISGHAFTPADHDGTEPVVVVNEVMATTLWPNRNPIGECLYSGPQNDSTVKCARVVGVVAVARRNTFNEEPVMQYYIPFGQEREMGGTNLLVRPRGAANASIATVRRAFQEMDPSIIYVQVQTLQESIDPQLRPWRLGAGAFGLLGALALLIAAVGLYSLLSYLVAQRTHEFGVRIALGAQRLDILALILRSSLGMATLGVIIGLGISLALARFIEPLLFDTSARDPLVLGSVAGTLLLVALVASLVPALRANRTNPLDALRAD